MLRGHLHQTRTERIVPPDSKRACLELAAGCAYQSSDHDNGYQWIELWPGDQRVRVQFRVWHQNQWMPDRNLPGCPAGVYDYRPDAPATPRDPPSRQALTIDVDKYLRDLLEETANIDIRGLVTGRPDAYNFKIEDLYIELSASGGEVADAQGKAGGKAGAMDGHRGPVELYRALKHPRLVIIGDPGAGKTTFLRWVAHALAGDRLEANPGAAQTLLGLDRARLPLLVRIADWLDYRDELRKRGQGPATAPTAATWLPAYLGSRAQAANQGLDSDGFQQLLKNGEALILLDGLDEAPDPRRRAEVVTLIEAVARAYRDCPLVVTSRPAAYRDKAVLSGFSQSTIEALNPATIHGFLKRWSQALFPNQPTQAESHRQALQGALEARREIRRMARNTVMLTALAVVHWNEKRLPEQRAELYESIIKWLAEAREDRPGRLAAQRCRQLLAELALAMQRGGGERDGNGSGNDARGRVVQVPRHQGAEWLAAHFSALPGGPGTDGDPTSSTAVQCAEAFLAEEELDSGIIVRRGNQLRFWHLTFQEYLAAQAIAGRPDDQQKTLLLGPDLRLYRAEWRESILLLAGVLYHQGEKKLDDFVSAILEQLYRPSFTHTAAFLKRFVSRSPALPRQARCAGLLGALVRDLEPYGYRPADPRYVQVLDAAMGIFDPAQARRIPILDRIAAADALARAGDPRLGWLQPQRWVALPGGRFAMGAQKTDPKAPGYDQDARENEAPVHEVEVSSFAIARFPVTVAEYAEFIEEGGYQAEQWWQAGGFGDTTEPEDLEPQQDHPSRPVTGVCWFEAAAYCAWLGGRLSRPQGAKGAIPCPEDREVRLPTEAEWEFVARGSEGRRYPWGNDKPDRDRANFGVNEPAEPSPVGVFPGDCTPEGVLDMAGNVVEWCLDVYDDNTYRTCRDQGVVTDPTGGDDATRPRVLRGGAFVGGSGGLRATDRGGGRPVYRSQGVGFRCVLAPRRQP